MAEKLSLQLEYGTRGFSKPVLQLQKFHNIRNPNESRLGAMTLTLRFPAS
jgi:hypothetical protein